jgi:S-adenosylmethionine hydrolase
MKRIVIITDCKDVALNEIRATIFSEIKPGKEFEIEIEPVVKVKEFSIVNAAFQLRLLAESYKPKDTIFLVIVNALRTDRKDRARIMGETENGFKFVGANTGALNWLIEKYGLKKLYEFDRKGLTGKDFVSFGGKYFHAPMAAKIALGAPLSELGEKRDISFLTDFKIEEGTVLHVDNFNTLKIKASIKDYHEGDKIKVKSKGKEIIAIFTKSMKDLPDNTWAIFNGSSLNGFPEIAKVRSLDAAKKLNIEVGDIVGIENHED